MRLQWLCERISRRHKSDMITHRNSCPSPGWKFGATMEYMLLNSPVRRGRTAVGEKRERERNGQIPDL